MSKQEEKQSDGVTMSGKQSELIPFLVAVLVLELLGGRGVHLGIEPHLRGPFLQLSEFLAALDRRLDVCNIVDSKQQASKTFSLTR